MRLRLIQPSQRSLAAAVGDARPTDMLLQLTNSLSFPGSLVLLLIVVERLDQATDHFRRRLE